MIIAPTGEIVGDNKYPSKTMTVWISQASEFIFSLTSSGTTADRPVKRLFIGKTYFDKTLGHPIWYDGTNWVDATGATV